MTSKAEYEKNAFFIGFEKKAVAEVPTPEQAPAMASAPDANTTKRTSNVAGHRFSYAPQVWA